MDGFVPVNTDILIAGGGTTGLVVATRLAKANPHLSITVLESGIGVRDDPSIVHPALYLSNILPGSKTATFYTSKSSESLAGRELVIPTGGCLGGGSSINFMVYSRPQMIDFDDWKTEGWRGEDMVPFLKVYENFQDHDPGIDKSLHGYGGEFSISPGTNAQTTFQEDYFEACRQIGIPQVPDVQNLKTSHAVGRWNMWVDQKTGRRQDVPHRLLYPLLDAYKTGLQVFTNIKVVRVLFNEQKRATGVEYVPVGPDSHAKPSVINATKLVVLASGTFGTPQILQRSGVGDAHRLSKLGINVVSNLPGVGQNYQDHHVIFYPYRSAAGPSETIDGIISGRFTLESALEQKKAQPTRYLLGWNGLDCVGKIRPSAGDEELLGPELRELWERDYRPRPTRPLMLMSSLAAFVGDHTGIPPGQHFSLGPYTPYPYSRGSIHITGPTVSDPPDFDCGFLNHPADIQKLLWGYKKQREIARLMTHYRGALEVGHPVFSKESKAGFKFVDDQDRKTGRYQPIEYSEKDDQAIELFIRQNVSTAWHSMGTCAMKTKEQGGVVDPGLNVFGVQGLKVVDLSICPSNVSANTYATALTVGHKAASIIAEELGLSYPI
ncbi:uncharacterized protein A1O5_10796 [Cladophialophora psammophila CBS 110553]|uniref:Glucose-methanol-choline oxidoreductase N-terminal domain-containing protein n=1 Tax=Cladophialophora psammophila CBS 110553 TaxID=1182543 RepID=W9WME4_9EURO|nr:uncharacterized protein A1O5_10796 [Cladophialophora psammophila CBS 110553]EXJ66180.1 hypothetical protein A1O5_10796 [Cladophialophora psammophila CBS 110553]